MTTRKFYRRTVTLEFISEEPYPGEISVETLISESVYGGMSMQTLTENNEEVDGKRAAEILQEQGSDPSFFQLTPEGEDTEE